MSNNDLTIIKKYVSQYKIFWISFIAVFIVVSLPSLGIHAPRFSSSLWDNTMAVFSSANNPFAVSAQENQKGGELYN